MTQPLPDRFLPIVQSLVRIVVGAAYFSHGGQKLFGWFGGMGGDNGTVELASRFGAAGVIEVVCGAALVLGLGTRWAAFIASGEMAVAYWWVHVVGRGELWWWANGGELSLVYCFVWLGFAGWGGGPLSLDARLAARRAQPA
ncbi:MAG: DoxX family protein [Gemmatimonadales bacterium]